ncbi:enoyl-CoA hydratase/isomerase family protein [Polynucleobacter sp. AP-Latsch-80-C2]|jgi:enoyl-CoA hydratase/carnithine racemase|uniref:enoyl-CoA hydratase/isomerase family protein n=1 Tax=Polynucleobacter sp. AP-Latsch-80-C2 TaxID=2576931 RepID=UPI001C0B4024|nr:enoyl-CoA hydratase/isomerase family protein [Polynucleobacter sp. AP-Latsch-80-C2]MBU3622278.1 enoyl-CoA hydratase/isomerase family protein [Polynucleobacter sp. AP-Latsch-80-C2]
MSNPSIPPCLDLLIDGNIARITFNNPTSRNAMTWSMYEELKTICDALAKNADIRVVIFRGAGDKAFVSGSDIEQFVHLKKDEAYEVDVDRIFMSLQELPMPTIAVIEGLAVGSGLLMATACDFRISTPDARFGIPVAKTLGNCLSPGNLNWISAHLGIPMVKKMLLTAELIKAPELLASGFLYQTVESSQITDAADALAKRMVVLAPITQKASKLGIARLLRSNLPNCTDLMRETYNSEDFREGVNAFLEGRPPQWRGK